jgi:rpsU-divergently transcribed protein
MCLNLSEEAADDKATNFSNAWISEWGVLFVADNWTQALAIHTSPGSLPSAIRQVSQLVDDIWYAAGDKSADLNWYTKRALLAGNKDKLQYP